MIYLTIVLLIWLLWVFFVAVMHLKELRDAGTLTRAQKAFGYPALAIGLALDVLVNATVATALFVELPREWLLSGRLWRLSHGDGWRAKLATAIRSQLLDSADPSGLHKG